MTSLRRSGLRLILLLLGMAALPVGRAAAQNAPVVAEPAVPADATPGTWQWSVDARAIFGVNYQRRKFRDFNTWEAQNWVMATGARPVNRGMLVLSSMLSLEPLTLRDIGSPQVFETGETFKGAPIIDYQHPHDLFMGLGGEYRRPFGRVAVLAALDVVGSPTLGPPAFMHRPSAGDNPQAPLSHHYMDSSHITPGVVRSGIEAGEWRVEASWFRGQEPDENRLDLDLGALDSEALRVSWKRGTWSAQVSGAYLTQPEVTTPYDAKRLTASIARTTGDDARGVAWFAAFGQNREIHGNLEAYLIEGTLHASVATSLYARAELVAKSILDAGFHPRGVFHRHRQSQIGALTLGYVRNVKPMRGGGFGVGADVTVYAVPDNLEDSYGSPVSFHVFLRFRAPRPSSAVPVHVH